jgi:hypothetical protein
MGTVLPRGHGKDCSRQWQQFESGLKGIIIDKLYLSIKQSSYHRRMRLLALYPFIL